jgi:hypothetical protein
MICFSNTRVTRDARVIEGAVPPRKELLSVRATQYNKEQLRQEFPFLPHFLDGDGGIYLDRLSPDDKVTIARMSKETAGRQLKDSFERWDNTGWFEIGAAILADGEVVPLVSGEKSEDIGVQLSNLAEEGQEVEYAVIYGWERQYRDQEEEQTLTIHKVKGKFDLSVWARRQRQRALTELEAALAAANTES